MIYVGEVPLNRTVFGVLAERTRYYDAIKDVPSPASAREILNVPLPIDLTTLQQCASAAIANHGLFGFIASDANEADPVYANQSLTFNPNVTTPEHRSTLGSPFLTRSEHFYGSPELMARLPRIRDSYYDTYGFRVPTTSAKTELAPLTSQLKRSMIRSRISVVRARRVEPARFMFGWHRDEEVFQNLRLNIPVVSAPEHRLQISASNAIPSEPSELAKDVFLEPGSIYSLDTNIPHRPCVSAVSEIDRIHVIVGVSPWFDYNEANDSWAPNEFFGKKHPFQMLLDGDVV